MNHIYINQNRKADFSMPYEFPLKIYKTQLKDKPHCVNEWHWHDEIQFCIVDTGIIKIMVQNHSHILKEGEGIFINAGRLHRTSSISSIPASYSCMNIHPIMLSFFRGSILEKKYVLPYLEHPDLHAILLKPAIPWQHNILDLQRKIQHTMEQKGDFYEFSIYSDLTVLWKELICNLSNLTLPLSTRFHQTEIKKMLSYIHEHFSESISLADIAASVPASKSWCCRIFKKALNCTILEYLTEYRIRQSISLLIATSIPISQIAYEVGFSDSSYFIKKFSETVHMTPMVYRKKAQSS